MSQSLNGRHPSRVAATRHADIFPDEGSDQAAAASRAMLIAQGRALFGVTGRFQYAPLGDARRHSGKSLGAAILLGATSGVALIALLAWPVLSENISATLGIGTGAMPLIVLASLAAASPPAVWLNAHRFDRRWLNMFGVTASGVCVTLLAVAGNIWTLVAGTVLGGVAIAVLAATQLPLLLDMYRPEFRARAIAAYFATQWACVAGWMLLVAQAKITTFLTWRATLLIAAMATFLLAVATAFVKDVAQNRWDEVPLARCAAGVGSRPPQAANASENEPVRIEEMLRRPLEVASTRHLLTVAACSGAAYVTLPTYLPVLWRDRFNHTGTTIQLGLALLAAVAAVSMAGWGKRAEIGFRRSPARVTQLGVWTALVASLLIAAAGTAGSYALSFAAAATAAALLAVCTASTAMCVLGTTEPRWRSASTALMVVATIGGGLAGNNLLTTIGTRFGIAWAFVATAGAGVVLAARAARATATVDRDFDHVVAEIVDRARFRSVVNAGQRVPLLTCRHLDFSYGQLQVLFGVDFSVDDGEMVALLGTNGAGKSTLLRAISGVGRPQAGSVHFSGRDITYLPYDERVQRGITQIPGGRAVFGAMSVVDNLRAYGHTLGRNRKSLTAGIDLAFDTFPRLAERRNQFASTLSGGEQQMLGLAKALILRPKLLLIDELSLGLAPKIVSELLTMVRQINASGAAVVLVEQSVNVALSVVEHAYFMERGQVRFDGRASELMARPDLLRAVFLTGTAAAT